MSIRYSTKHVLAVTAMAVLAFVVIASHPRSSLAENKEIETPVGEQVPLAGDAAKAVITAKPDGDKGGKLSIATRDADGKMKVQMQVMGDGRVLVGKRAEAPYSEIPGCMEVGIDWPSRPSVGDTFAFYASGHGQVFLMSSWLVVVL